MVKILNNMAGCYHDTQDFKSDLNIEVAIEVDILEAGQDLKKRKCDKNPGHRDFIPFKDLTLEDLPIEHRSIEILEKIKNMGCQVVRLLVRKAKGTGFVYKFHNTYYIMTNSHVVKTDDELKHCTVEFNYDSKNRSNVLPCKGVDILWTDPYKDITAFTFHPVPDFLHQLDMVGNKLPSIVIMYTNYHSGTQAIYPNYKTSQLQFHSELNLNSSLINLMFISSPDNSISYMKSSYFKFQPIPSNIQELTSMEVHIDEDEGNNRVITGDVVKLGDEFVVKIPESIFQEEVKKCKLVWNGEVISRGTRLYFQQVHSSDIYSGIDLERHIEKGRENYWTFGCHPVPRYLQHVEYIKHTSNMCCIGHPHGLIKMVTFGRFLGDSLDRFDNQYRRVTAPGPDCQCEEVNCVKYSCKTCPGSSGSPVFLLHDGMDLNSSLNHFMGEPPVKELLPSGELIEKNINIAWATNINKW